MIHLRIIALISMLMAFTSIKAQIILLETESSRKDIKKSSKDGCGSISFEWSSKYQEYEFYILQDTDNDGVYEKLVDGTRFVNSELKVNYNCLPEGKFLFYIQARFIVPAVYESKAFEIEDNRKMMKHNHNI